MPQSDRLKIAVSGFTGTGKTSLCAALAENLDLKLIPENAGEIVRGEENVRRVGLDSHGDVAVLLAAKEVLARLYPNWAADRSDRIKGNDRLIADRWHLDLLIWWMLSFRGARGAAESWTTILYKEMKQIFTELDLVVVTPMIQPFGLNGSSNVDDLTRAGDVTNHLLFQSLLRGLITSTEKTRILVLPARPLTVEERVDCVIRALER